MSDANARQVGGSHYQSTIQHWDFVTAYGLGYFEGQITKYISRHAKKNGYQDVEKAIHYTQKLVEEFRAGRYLPTHATVEPTWRDWSTLASDFCVANDLSQDDSMVVKAVCRWRCEVDLMRIKRVLQSIAAKYQNDGSHPQARGYVDQDGPTFGYHHDGGC